MLARGVITIKGSMVIVPSKFNSIAPPLENIFKMNP